MAGGRRGKRGSGRLAKYGRAARHEASTQWMNDVMGGHQKVRRAKQATRRASQR